MNIFCEFPLKYMSSCAFNFDIDIAFAMGLFQLCRTGRLSWWQISGTVSLSRSGTPRAPTSAYPSGASNNPSP